jgi:hypothetical protein
MYELSEYILLGGLTIALFSICWSVKIIFCEDRNRYDNYKPISVNDDNT